MTPGEPVVPRGSGARPLPWARTTDLISWAAAEYGQREFLRADDGQNLTFEVFDQLTAELADRLAERGVRPGDRVAVVMENGPTWPVVWQGVVRAGGIAVPVNKKYRAADLGFVLNDSGARYAIADDATWPIVEQCVADAPGMAAVWGVELDSGAIGMTTRSEADPCPPRMPEADDWNTVANLQYTSGTTGFPKACVLPDSYWLRSGLLTAEVARLNADDVVLTAQPYSYIDPQWQTMMCLVSGATLVVLPGFSASRYWEAVRRHQATFVYVLATMPVMLYRQPPSALDRQHRVRMILCSAINPEMHRAFEERWGAPWREAYGMTETAIDLAARFDDVETVGSGVAGRPLDTKAVRVVDADGHLVPNGTIGELQVKGEPMMLRYHRREEETARAIKDGWLSTGDLVTQDEQGWVTVVGRNKDMVRRAGENIAAAEVEAVVASHPDVAMCAVVPVPDDVMGEEVKVVVQLRSEYEGPRTETATALVEHTRQRLAPFKVPRFVEFTDSFPMTPSERIAKPRLTRDNPRDGAYDAVERVWC